MTPDRCDHPRPVDQVNNRLRCSRVDLAPDHQIDPQIRLICPVGGLILFSAAQMHSSVPNTSGVTRFSIDFRTVNIDDVQSRREASNVDSECTGTSLRDFLRARDFQRIAEGVALTYEGLTGADA